MGPFRGNVLGRNEADALQKRFIGRPIEATPYQVAAVLFKEADTGVIGVRSLEGEHFRVTERHGKVVLAKDAEVE